MDRIAIISVENWPPNCEALSLGAASLRLRSQESTDYFAVGPTGSSRGRLDSNQVPSNSPTEDQYSAILAQPGKPGPWTITGVFDGHAGWATSAWLRDHLIPLAKQHIEDHPQNSGSHAHPLGTVFQAADDLIMKTALAAVQKARQNGRFADPDALAALAPAVAGSCALVAAYNATKGDLLVACTGDSRAVLGRRQEKPSDGSSPNPARERYIAVPMSVDQSGSNADEIARLDAAHPDEPDMLKGLQEKGRIFGLMVTRAFGDHRWKWDAETVKEIQETHFGPGPRPGAVSQPYLSASPVITETKVQVGEDGGAEGARPGDFVILASDGLWDHISSEDAVYVVEEWLAARESHKGKASQSLETDADTAAAEDGNVAREGKLFHSNEGYAEWKFQRDWLAIEDDNAATHLIRNALGGKNRGFFCGLLSTYAPMSRNVRDDITVQVAFFGGV